MVSSHNYPTSSRYASTSTPPDSSPSAFPPDDHHSSPDPISPVLESLGLDPRNLYAADGPTAPATAAQFSTTSFALPFDNQQQQRILRQAWLAIFSCLPGIQVLLPNLQNASQQPVTPDQAVNFLAQHEYSLSKAQRATVQSLATAPSSHAKGKRPAHVLSPSRSTSHFSSRDSSPSQAQDANQDDDPIALGPEYSPERRGMPCGHVFARGEAIWRCRDCALDDTCVQCAPCFMASVHVREKHNAVFSVSANSGGCCDCGDHEAWVRDVGCTYHSHSTPDAEDDHIQTDDDDDEADLEDDEEEGENTQRGPDLPNEVLNALRSACATDDFAELIQQILRPWLDFILATLAHAPEEQKLYSRSFVRGATNSAAHKVTSLQGLDEWAAGVRAGASHQPSSSSSLHPTQPVYPSRLPQPPGAYDFDQNFGYGLPSPAKPDTPGAMWGSLPIDPNSPLPNQSQHEHVGRKYALLLWNDEKHSFMEVIDSVHDALGISEAEGRAIADKVDQKGRHILAVSSDVHQLVGFVRRMTGIDLEVTIRPAFDVFCEEVAHWLIAVIKDLADANMYDEQGKSGNASILRLLLSSELLQQWSPQFRKPDSFASPHIAKDFFDPSRLCKLDGMLLMDHKLWKEARALVRGWYMAIVARKEGRRTIAFRFAAMYSRIMETFILREREPEHSVVLLTVQLFSVPSIGSHLVRHSNFLEKLLAILRAIYTGYLVPAAGTLCLPADLPLQAASPDATLLRQQYCRHIFYDVRYLLQSDGVKKQLAADPRHIAYCAEFLSRFTAFLPEVRQRDHHVEFEASELWVAVFSVCHSLARQAKLIGEAFEHATAEEVIQCVDQVTLQAAKSSALLHAQDPLTHPPFEVRPVAFGSQLYPVVPFRVDLQATSLYHPLHWLWAECSKRLSLLRHSDLTRHGTTHIRELLSISDESELLFALDFPLRSITKVAQVKIGLWVRNGNTTRGQVAHYRDVTMRACMYDQDVFLLQAGLGMVSDPDHLLVTFMNRFDLVQYFDGKPLVLPTGRVGDEERQAVLNERALTEEFLLVLHTLLSEPSGACGWPFEKVIRRELIHYLALNQGTYSSLTRNIPDSMTEHPAFENLLEQVSVFRAPDGTSDLGIFELKDEFYDEVNPYFYHYSRNQRETAEEQLRTREKKAGRSPEALVPVPQRGLSGEGSGPFAASIARAFTSPVMKRTLYYALHNNVEAQNMHVKNVESQNGGEPQESLLDVTLQIIIVGIVELGSPFVESTLCGNVEQKSTGAPTTFDDSILKLLCAVEEDLKIKTLKAKVTWCLDQASFLSGDTVNAVIAKYRKKSPAVQSEGSSARGKNSKQMLAAKKAAAKARQQAIMQKFSAQQKSLLESLGDEEEMEDARDVKPKKEAVEDDSMMVDEEEEHEEEESLGTCIMCQEDFKRDGSFGCLGLISPSNIIRTTPRNDLKALKEVAQVPLTLDRSQDPSQPRTSKLYQGNTGERYSPVRHLGTTGGGFGQADHKHGFVTSTCGHLLHVRCFETYYRGIEHRHGSQIARNHPEDLSRYEFVCPLCKSLGNVVLPVAESQKSMTSAASSAQPSIRRIGEQELDSTPIGGWIRTINSDILKTQKSQFSAAFQETSTGTGCFTHWYTDNALSAAAAKDDAPMNLPEEVDEHTLTMLLRVIVALKPLAASTRPARTAWQSRTILAPVSRKMYFPEEVVAYTLSTMEIAQRGIPSRKDGVTTNVALAISDGNIGLLRSLIVCMRSIVAIEAFNLPGKTHAAAREDYTSAMRHGLLLRLLPHWASDEVVRYPLLLRDPLTILIEAAAIAPQYLSQITTLMYYATLVQTIFGLAQPSVWPQATGSSHATRGLAHISSSGLSAQDKAALKQIFPDVRWSAGNIVNFVGYARGNISLGIENLDDESLAKMLCSYTLPFLRRAAILRRVVCGNKTFDHAARASRDAVSEPVEYLRLLEDLEILPPAQALPLRAEKQSAISGIMEGWVKHAYATLSELFKPLPINPVALGNPSSSGSGRSTPLGAGGGGNHSSGSSSNQTNLLYLQAANQTPQILQLEHPHVYELVALPHDLTALLQYSQQTKCQRCKQVPPSPALCLFCGTLVCYQSFCCMDQETSRGECNRHMVECAGNVGLFFKPKANTICVLYYSRKGTHTDSPYLDSHGEVDVHLQKGRPQRLHRHRADELRKTWLSGGLAAVVARRLEATMDVGGWDST